jgi:adenine-specific DNA-methyltransferase
LEAVASRRKQLGAYYTDETVSDAIARWALTPGCRALDPSCGDGAFLRSGSAAAASPRELVGVEIDRAQALTTRRALAGRECVRVVHGDFFDYHPRERFDAVIGNPPFIRYQAFAAQSREKALARSRAAGVELNRLANSWAHFVVVASEMLADGGRLGLVLPVELLHAGYAKPVLNYLARNFAAVTVVTFRRRLFPELSQDTLVLLAAGRGSACTSFRHVDAASIADFGLSAEPRSPGTALCPEACLVSGTKRLRESFVDPSAVALLERLLESKAAFRLGARFSVDIGYVTGANAFFHLTPQRARDLGIATRFLTPAVYRGRALRGVRYTTRDWTGGHQSADSGYLLRVQTGGAIPAALRRYVEDGERCGYSRRYKCGIRTPWFSVPHVCEAAAFLTSMSGDRPRIVVNEAGVVSSNSLHVLRSRRPDGDARAAAFSWLSSFSALSAELEGHPLGGGMLKLEPGEAERVVVADAGAPPSRTIAALDRLVRRGAIEDAVELADRAICDRFGIAARQMRSVRAAAAALRERRRKQVA